MATEAELSRAMMLCDVLARVTEHDDESEHCILCTVQEALLMLSTNSPTYWDDIENFFRQSDALSDSDTPFERKWVRQ